jgi:hypothetical protein
MAAAEARVELGFDGGGVLRCTVAADQFESLVQAFLADERTAVELVVDGERAVVDLRRCVYVRGLRNGRPISFAE